MNQDNKNDNDMHVQQALVEKKSPISSIWLLPVVAALIGLWLLFQAYNDKGVDITIRVGSADGIVIGKTEVRFKGFPLGIVNDLQFTEDLKYVDVSVEMVHSTKKYLNENSLIWLVKPEISLSGVSGLDTVITGNYFEMLPELGKQKIRHFVSLSKPPPKSEDSPGLHITLHAKELGSVSHGTNIYYKQIVVGEVYSYDLSESKDHIEIKLLIKEEYADLVKLNTRFWNASGVEMTGDLSGFKVRTQSLASIIGGGIAFYSPDAGDMTTEVQNFTEYPLFEDFDEARAGINVKMHFPKNSGIKAGITKVLYEGIEVGLVEDYVYDKERGGVTADVYFDPRLEPYLLSETEFWLVKPTVSLAGISNIDRLLSGSFISFRIGGGEATREFDVLPIAPPMTFDQPGLHLNIIADSVDSLSFGSPIFYKNLKVGSVQEHRLTNDKRQFNVHVFIEPAYQDLVNDTSVFYEQGGIEMSGSLIKSFSIKTAPLQAMLAGGLSFQTIDFVKGDTIKNGHTFNLNRNLEDALNTESITVVADDKYELIPGITKLMLGDKQIGMVKTVRPTPDLESSIVTVGYQSDYKEAFKESSKIWIVEPTLASGNVAGFNALITGSFLQVKQGKGSAKTSFNLLTKAPAKVAEDKGLQITFNAKNAGSIQVSSPITYKKMYIGEIDSINFSSEGLGVDVSVTIHDDFRHLVSEGSKFYLASGFNVKADMTGMVVQTASMQSILRGGIALDNNRANPQKPSAELSKFTLHASYQDMLESGKDINITFNQVIDINENATVQYQSHIVGHVKSVKLNADLTKTELSVSLNKDYASLAKESTQFWHIQPEVSPARVANTKAFFTGNYLGVKPGQGEDKSNFIGLMYAPAVTQLPSGLNLALTSKTRGSLQPASPIYYRQIKVGQVLGSSLNSNADGVLIYVNIEEKFKHLVNTSSEFYNVSGVEIDAGVFSGVKVNTESLETILAGGIAFATKNSTATQLENAATVTLNNEADEDWLKWNPKLTK